MTVDEVLLIIRAALTGRLCLESALVRRCRPAGALARAGGQVRYLNEATTKADKSRF
jgi:hypothetical protein